MKPSPLEMVFFCALVAAAAGAGTFNLTEDIQEGTPDAVAHPLGYDGTGGHLTVKVCIDPSSPFAAELVAPVTRVIQTLNALEPTVGTYVPIGESLQVPDGYFDAESVVLHEVAHCIGLGHVNVAGKLSSALALAVGDAAMSTEGPDADYTFVFVGGDNTWGSADDLRGDDVNLSWFPITNNDPFQLPDLPAPSYDQSNYSRKLSDLPEDDEFAAVGTPKVAEVLGYEDTKSVMYTQTGVDSEFRSLSHDDVIMLRYIRSGINEIAGDGDDYDLTLQLVDFPCDLPIHFESFGVGSDSVGRCRFANSAAPIGGSSDHFAVLPVAVELNSDFSWFFGPTFDLAVTKSDGEAEVLPGGDVVYTLEVSNVGEEVEATGVQIEETVPEFTTFHASASDAGWSCTGVVAGSDCVLSVGTLPAGGPPVQAVFAVTVLNPLPAGVEEIFNLVQVSHDGANGPDPNPGNNLAQDSTPVGSGLVFEDDFESGDATSWSQSVP